MGRRYYCDYCDKAFIDVLEARKKHLQSAYHLNFYRQHYDTFKEPKELLAREIVKIPCNRYMQTGYCGFGDNCKFTHYTPEGLWSLKLQIDAMEIAATTKPSVAELPSVESWLHKYEESKENKDKSNCNTKTLSWFWTYPEKFECRTDLPPSIKKFKAKDFTDSEFAEWGV